MLHEIGQPARAKVNEWQETLVDYPKPLVEAEKKDAVAERVKLILDEAITIAQDLARSRTWTIVQRKSLKADDCVLQRYDSAWMEIIEKSIAHYEEIDFLVTPALVQLSNSASEVFQDPIVVVKAEVCFGKGPFHFYGPAKVQPLPKQEEITGETLSGRQVRAVARLGNVADNIKLEEVIEEDHDVVRDSASDSYADESAGGDDH
jgi:hypothetical protein